MRDFARPGRSMAVAASAMAATSHPAATLAALDVLRAGGNAVDAAIAACALQCVVEPASTGIGGDGFVLMARADGSMRALNGSGRAPAALDLEALAERGVDDLEGSVHAITVPGSIDAWCRLLEAEGTRSLDELLRPAIQAAEDGFAVTPRVAFDWSLEGERLTRSEAATRFYLPAGRPPVAGVTLRLPALAGTLREIGRRGRDGFYDGPVAEAMVGFLAGEGGTHRLDDFAAARAEWVEPIRAGYRGLDVHQCPPNGQGVIALLLLNILEGLRLSALDPTGPERFHLEAEATRLAFRDRDAVLADPAQAEVPVETLLDKAYAASLRGLIDPDRALPELPPPLIPAHRDTVYLTVVDRDGTVVSFINSLFDGFGSGLACPQTGVLFHNRGKGFSLQAGHPNALAPGKRPMHTIIPALAMQGGRPAIGFGVMGGHYQPVGQAHVLTNLLAFDMDPQAALDGPRAFAINGEMQVESGVPAATVEGLRRRGHRTVRPAKPLGGGQMIVIDRVRGVLLGGSDPRKDGLALGY